MKNFIKIDRKILQWEWYKNEHTKNVFFHCLLKAYWKDKKIEGKIIPRGSFVSSIGKMAEELDLTPMEVRTALKHLKLTNEVTSKGTNKNTVFTVTNYDLYQTKEQTDKQTDNEQTTIKEQTINNPLTTNEESKEDNKDEESKEIEKEKREEDTPPLSPSQEEIEDKGKTKKKTTKASNPKVFYPNEEKLNQAFLDFMAMRNSIKKPMTDRASTMAMNKLERLSAIPFSDSMDNDLAIKILEQSTFACWTDLYALKEDRKKSQSGSSLVDEWRNA